MCGIFGYAGIVNKEMASKLHYLVAWLAAESEVRGVDSTGFAARFDSGHIIIDKMPFRASIFTSMSHKFKLMARNMPSTFIGHTRLGTGSSPIINNNNHPFIGKKFHMVHNGVIPSWRDIAKENSLTMQSETDSEIILRLLEDRNKNSGIIKNVEWILENIWGNMAVALLDQRNPHIWLFRNENPIYVFEAPAKIFGNQFLFFCSTKPIFDAAWKQVFKASPGDMKVISHNLDDNQLFRISTKPTKVKNAKSGFRFTVNKLNVKRKFRVGKQYYGNTVGASDDYGRYNTSGKYSSLFSKLLDINDISKGLHFSKSQVNTINSAINTKGEKKNLLLDGLSIDEYAMLKTFVGDFIDFEKKSIHV